MRIGNAAAGQLQIDVYGEVIDAFYQGLRGGLPARRRRLGAAARAARPARRDAGDQPDRGIWESRGEPRHYVYSKVMAWVAFDRGVRMIAGIRPRRPGRGLGGRCAR